MSEYALRMKATGDCTPSLNPTYFYTCRAMSGEHDTKAQLGSVCIL
jgi:hypothetical protein